MKTHDQIVMAEAVCGVSTWLALFSSVFGGLYSVLIASILLVLTMVFVLIEWWLFE